MLESWVLAVQKEKTRCWEAWYRQFRKKKLDGSWVLAVQKEQTRCWEAWYWQFGEQKSERITRCWEAWYRESEKKKLDAGKLGISSSKRKNLMLESLVLAVR
jgi:hypothetical protein